MGLSVPCSAFSGHRAVCFAGPSEQSWPSGRFLAWFGAVRPSRKILWGPKSSSIGMYSIGSLLVIAAHNKHFPRSAASGVWGLLNAAVPCCVMLEEFRVWEECCTGRSAGGGSNEGLLCILPAPNLTRLALLLRFAFSFSSIDSAHHPSWRWHCAVLTGREIPPLLQGAPRAVPGWGRNWTLCWAESSEGVGRRTPRPQGGQPWAEPSLWSTPSLQELLPPLASLLFPSDCILGSLLAVTAESWDVLLSLWEPALAGKHGFQPHQGAACALCLCASVSLPPGGWKEQHWVTPAFQCDPCTGCWAQHCLLSSLGTWMEGEKLKQNLRSEGRNGAQPALKVSIADTFITTAFAAVWLRGAPGTHCIMSSFCLCFFPLLAKRPKGREWKNYLFVLSNLIYVIYQTDRLFGKPDGPRLKSSVFPTREKWCQSGHLKRGALCVVGAQHTNWTSAAPDPPSAVPEPM